jgi:hypothetical protein
MNERRTSKNMITYRLLIYLFTVILIGLLSLVFIKIPSEQVTQLRYLIIVSRHGIRAPVRVLPKDIYNKTFWERKHRGLSKLTQAGMEQEFQFGKFIKNYYIDFFDSVNETKNFHPDMYLRYTDFDRSYFSSVKFLYGFFENSKSVYDSSGFFTQLEKYHPDFDMVNSFF